MRELKEALHLGVLGNFAINENSDGSNSLSVKPLTNAPSGLVATYVPFQKDSQSILSTFPLSFSKIKIPTIYDNIQIEPEIALSCEVKYYNNSILYIIPKKFTVYNDATLHRLSVSKIAENKNWGVNSKGIASKWIDIDNFEKGGVLSNYRLVSFIKRDGVIEQYSIDTPVDGYGYMYEDLIDWIVEEVKRQKDILSLDSISSFIKSANYPNKFLINIGTTLYTEIGERVFLEDGDEIFIVAYDKNIYRPESIKAYLLAYKTRKVNYEGMIILHQTAYL